METPKEIAEHYIGLIPSVSGGWDAMRKELADKIEQYAQSQLKKENEVQDESALNMGRTLDFANDSNCKICFGSGVTPSHGLFLKCDCQYQINK